MKENKEQDRKSGKLKVGITMGDAGGIGPELIIRVFQESPLREMFIPIIYGSGKALNFYRKVLSIDKFNYSQIQNPAQAQIKKVNLIDCGSGMDRIEIGLATEAGGRAALEALDLAISHIKSKEIDALVTLPLDKNTVAKANPGFSGHTGYLAQQLGGIDPLMFLISEHLKMGLVTEHVALKDVAGKISSRAILNKIRLMHDSLKNDFSVSRPRIAVLSLNPHAGDEGLLGKEENEVIIPAIKESERDGIMAIGPYAADGFFAAGLFKRFDGVLAMYHDQGLVPFKLLASFSGINYTAGLPVVRTSPDHGVAYDLAGKNEASVDSFLNALYAAYDICNERTENEAINLGSLKNKGIKVEMNEADEEIQFEEQA